VAALVGCLAAAVIPVRCLGVIGDVRRSQHWRGTAGGWDAQPAVQRNAEIWGYSRFFYDLTWRYPVAFEAALWPGTEMP
jgi:hypothetical protein